MEVFLCKKKRQPGGGWAVAFRGAVFNILNMNIAANGCHLCSNVHLSGE